MQTSAPGHSLREFFSRQEAAHSLAQRIKQALLFELVHKDKDAHSQFF
jgi:hypothetical protein